LGGNKTIRVPPTREETERENRKFFESQKEAAKKKGQVKFQEPSPKTRTREKGQQEVITKKRKRNDDEADPPFIPSKSNKEGGQRGTTSATTIHEFDSRKLQKGRRWR
jgi:hypothetical protein